MSAFFVIQRPAPAAACQVRSGICFADYCASYLFEFLCQGERIRLRFIPLKWTTSQPLAKEAKPQPVKLANHAGIVVSEFPFLQNHRYLDRHWIHVGLWAVEPMHQR